MRIGTNVCTLPLPTTGARHYFASMNPHESQPPTFLPLQAGKKLDEPACQVIEDTQAFGELNFSQVCALAKYLHVCRAENGATIFNEGDPGDFACLLLDGRVDLYKENTRREKKLIHSLSKGKIFGEVALIDGETRSATAIATATSSVIILTRAEFKRLSDEKPGLALRILTKFGKVLSQRLRQTSGVMVEYSGE